MNVLNGLLFWVFPGGSDGKVSACNAEDLGSIPGSGRSPGEGNGSPLQYSCLENSMDGGAWWATVHDATESDMTEQPQSSLDIHVAIIRSVRATIVANLLQFPYLANCSLNYSTECWREHFSNRPTSAVIKGLRFQDLKVRHSE